HADGDVLGNSEGNWNRANLGTEYLISTKDGSKKVIAKRFNEGPDGFTLSPQGKFVIYFDDQRNYFSYEVPTGITRLIIKGSLLASEDRHGDRREDGTYEPYYRTYVEAWMPNDKAVILKAPNDLW